MALVLVLVAVLLETAEQTCFRAGSGPGTGVVRATVTRRAVFTGLGVGLNVAGMGVLIVALRHAPLGMVVPLLASTNVTVALAGAWLFGERITPRRWAGVLLITVGVALVSSSFRE